MLDKGKYKRRLKTEFEACKPLTMYVDSEVNYWLKIGDNEWLQLRLGIGYSLTVTRRPELKTDGEMSKYWTAPLTTRERDERLDRERAMRVKAAKLKAAAKAKAAKKGAAKNGRK